jgi:hypothetical protein
MPIRTFITKWQPPIALALIALAESRKMEIEIVKAYMLDRSSVKTVEADLEKLNRLIEKIKKQQ